MSEDTICDGDLDRNNLTGSQRLINAFDDDDEFGLSLIHI